MPINFPTSLDTITNPNTTDALNSPSHAGQHATANDILEALEAKVGADSSAVTSSHDYKIAQLETGKVAANAAITGATKTKITYDAKGLVTAGEDATTADIADSSNKRYVTDANLTAIGTIGDKEATANKENSTIDTSTTKYPTVNLLKTGLDTKLPLAGGTMTGKIVKAGTTEVGKTYTPATGSQTVTIDCSVNNIHIVSGHADGTAITFAISNATNSQPFIISILQGAVVSTITAWFATVRWAGGTAPTLTATANKRDTFGFIRTGADTYDGFIIGQNC